MEAEADGRRRVAELVAKRRRHLRLSVSRAAALAGIHRATWTSIEEGTRDTEDYIYGAVEQVLGWKPDSIDAIMRGEDPTLAEAPQPAEEPAGDRAVVRQVKMILDSELALSAETKLAMIRDVISRDHVPDEAEQREAPTGHSERRRAVG